jgi:hypothetical protein
MILVYEQLPNCKRQTQSYMILAKVEYNFYG